MEFETKDGAGAAPAGLPAVVRRARPAKTAARTVAFGHWSTLGWCQRPDLLSTGHRLRLGRLPERACASARRRRARTDPGATARRRRSPADPRPRGALARGTARRSAAGSAVLNSAATLRLGLMLVEMPRAAGLARGFPGRRGFARRRRLVGLVEERIARRRRRAVRTRAARGRRRARSRGLACEHVARIAGLAVVAPGAAAVVDAAARAVFLELDRLELDLLLDQLLDVADQARVVARRRSVTARPEAPARPVRPMRCT